MGVRLRAIDTGRERGRDLLASLLREIQIARIDRSLSYAAIASTLGLSPSQVRRLLHGATDDPGLVRLAEVCAIVGLELTSRAYPLGDRLRDRPQQTLLARFTRRLGPGCTLRTEVPVVELATPGSVDLRAWDAAIDGPGWTARLDAETRVGDLQALQRRIALKQRDSRVPVVILLLGDTRHNRSVVREADAAIRSQFPVSARFALRRLARAESPAGNCVVLL